MPQYCAIVKCGSRSGRDNVSFHRFPSIFDNRKRINPLAELRRELWIQATRRADLTSVKLKWATVCSKHFVAGKPAALTDVTNPDWVPNQNLNLNPSTRWNSKQRTNAELPDATRETRQVQVKNTENTTVSIKKRLDSSDSDTLSCDEQYISEDNTGENIDESLLEGLAREDIEIQYEPQDSEEIDTKDDTEETEIEHENLSNSYYYKDKVEIAYQCKICPREFSNQKSLGNHLKAHERRRNFQCKFCKRWFKRLEHYQKHLTLHAEKSLFNCTDCGRMFQTEGNLFIHRQRAHAKPYQCCMCPLNFALPEELKAHENKHSQYKTFQCEECDEKFVAKPFYEMHMREHERNKRRLQCGACDLMCSSREELDRHLMIHSEVIWSPEHEEETNPDQHQCTTCGEFFSNAKELGNHEQKHAQENHSLKTSAEEFFESDFDETEFESEKNNVGEEKLQQDEDDCGTGGSTAEENVDGIVLQQDEDDYSTGGSTAGENVDEIVREDDEDDYGINGGIAENNSIEPDCELIELHVEVNDETDNTNPETQFKCKICGAGFSEKAHLKNHMSFHGNRRKFRCQICYLVFWEKSLLDKHLEDFPAGSCLKCPVCRKRFTTRNQLHSHRRSAHATDLPFKCKVCPKAFVQIGLLQKHEAIHFREKTFECGICGKSFAHESYLRRHVLLHDNPQSFQPKIHKCHLCDKEYKDKTSLRKHVKTHNKVKKYQCAVCFRYYARQYQVERHFMQHMKSAEEDQGI